MVSAAARRNYTSQLALVVGLAFAMWLCLTLTAFGYSLPIGGPAPYYTSNTCADCHAKDSVAAPGDGSGPHKNFTATTHKCSVCHSVHNAPAGGILLLPGATVSATCQTCHDGTAAKMGVYTAITSRTGNVINVKSEHTVLGVGVTKVIPGGSTDLASNLSCSSCHSVHGANTVAPFLRDSGRASNTFASASDAYVTSDCLLRSDLRDQAAGTYAEYGAQWCAACHDNRHSTNTNSVMNHSVTTDATWGYDDVITTVLGAPSMRTENAGPGLARSMGRTNAGYVMPPVAESEDGRVTVRRTPMCQQCHEDARDVELAFDGDYTGRGTLPFEDGSVVPFLTFPHQTTNLYMTVETGDDLCLNCHLVTALP